MKSPSMKCWLRKWSMHHRVCFRRFLDVMFPPYYCTIKVYTDIELIFEVVHSYQLSLDLTELVTLHLSKRK